MEGNKEAKAIFDRWLAPLKDLGATRNIIEGIGATDHVPFNEAGLPGFNVIKDFRAYDELARQLPNDIDQLRTMLLPGATGGPSGAGQVTRAS